MLTMARTGLSLGAWENAARYVWNDREQFGMKVGQFQGMQHQLAQAWTEIQAARALVFNAARLKEAGKDFVREAAMAKLFSSQVAGRVSGSAIEWMGGMGFVREGIAEKMVSLRFPTFMCLLLSESCIADLTI